MISKTAAAIAVAITTFLPLDNRIMAQNKESVENLMALHPDSVIEMAMQLLQDAYPKLCNPENNFNTGIFDLIMMEKIDTADVRVSFDHIFTVYKFNSKPLVYRVSVDLMSRATSIYMWPDTDYAILDQEPVPFFVLDQECIKAVRMLVKALTMTRSRSEPGMTEAEIMKTIAALRYEVTEQETFYDVAFDSGDTAGWLKIDKQTLQISDERHKHYGRTADERNQRILKQDFNVDKILKVKPNLVNSAQATRTFTKRKRDQYFINDRAVTKIQFQQMFKKLKEVENTWYCEESTDGGTTGYNVADENGVLYEYGVSSHQRRRVQIYSLREIMK